MEVEVETRKVTRTRDVKLSQAEAADLGIEVGRLASEIEVHKKAAKDAETAQDEAIATLKRNSIAKDVECIMKLFFLNRTVEVWDGEERLEERPMTDAEFQMDFRAFDEVKKEIDESREPLTQDEARMDLEEVIREERNKFKQSMVDSR
jgi:hypothetical protein